MKKLYVCTMAAAFAAGCVNTVLAAENPFADVPREHWAYAAVEELAEAGLVNGYAVDGSFRGNQAMSRYEMAQLVAKAMARSEAADNNQKAAIDRLVAEFADELSGLGTRVADLENKADNVQWHGMVSINWNTRNFAGSTAHRAWNNGNAKGDNLTKLRLEPVFTINEHWTAHSRIDYIVQHDNNDGDSSGQLYRLWAQGEYGKWYVRLGRFPTNSEASHGLVIDDPVTGLELQYAPSDRWRLKATAGRYALDGHLSRGTDTKLVPGAAGAEIPVTEGYETKDNATYWAVEANYNIGKLEAGAGYHTFMATHTQQEYPLKDNGSFHVIDVGAAYAFDKNFKLTADYAWGPSLQGAFKEAGARDNAYSLQLDYRMPNLAQPRSWGAYVAYRQFAPFATVETTYDLSDGFYEYESMKGLELCFKYVPAKNILANVMYFVGRDTVLRDRGDRVSCLWGNLDFYF